MRTQALIRASLLLLLLVVQLPASATDKAPQVILPKAQLTPAELGVIVNDEDPDSVRVADYYMKARGIPKQNLIHVRIPLERPQISARDFAGIKSRVDARTPDRVQAYALTWVEPYRVGCMSITTAFAYGFDPKWCSEKGRKCSPTAPGSYYNSPSLTPWDDLQVRPTVAIAGLEFKDAKALIDRGVASDATWPTGTAYLLDTSDKARTVRSVFFPKIEQLFSDLIDVEVLHQDYLYDRDDVLFYFTGHKRVKGLDTLHFVPGAIADHLTSGAGQLTAGWQMSSLRWLEAGATGSFGAVKEPCNFIAKFPNPGIVMGFYLQGATLLEAYWKSVAMPGEGIFIGEPLAAPFSGYRIEDSGDHWTLQTHELRPGNYLLVTAPSGIGPYQPQKVIVNVTRGETRFQLPKLDAAVYRLEPVSLHRE